MYGMLFRSSRSQPETVESPGPTPVLRQKIGVLIANLGTPDAPDYWSVRRYLSEFLSDRRVVDYSPLVWQPILQTIVLLRRPFISGTNYRRIWNRERDESPLLTTIRSQADRIRAELLDKFPDQELIVDFCMRYGNPSTKSKIQELIVLGCNRILFFPLYPQYASATVASANDQLFRSLMEEKFQPAIRVVPAYYDYPAYITALAQSIEKVWNANELSPDLLVCSYHGLPARFTREGDPYYYQCLETTRLLQACLGWKDGLIATTFQSRFGPEEWLRPYTVEEVARLARSGIRRIAICAPSFSADCLETLEEIQGEIRTSFEHAGGLHFVYIPCLNDDASHVSVLSSLIIDNLKGWIREKPQVVGSA